MTMYEPILDHLSLAALDASPIETDWSVGWTDTWEHYEAPYSAVRWDEDACAWIDAEGEECEEVYGEGPMMNYRYPLPNFTDDPHKAAEKLMDLPLCLVEYEGGWYLALTGGGMDLSWEICAAYIALGYLPPAYFCGSLPHYAGGPRIPEILSACHRSLVMESERAEWVLKRFRDNWIENAE